MLSVLSSFDKTNIFLGLRHDFGDNILNMDNSENACGKFALFFVLKIAN